MTRLVLSFRPTECAMFTFRRNQLGILRGGGAYRLGFLESGFLWVWVSMGLGFYGSGFLAI